MHTWLEPLIFSYTINVILLLLVVGTPLLSLLALLQLRRHRVHGTELSLWVITILFIPILGAIAYFITGNRQLHDMEKKL